MEVGRIEKMPQHTDMHQKVEVPAREARPFSDWGCGVAKE